MLLVSTNTIRATNQMSEKKMLVLIYTSESIHRLTCCAKRPRGRAVSTPTLNHGVAGSNPAGGEILPEPKRRFIAQSLSCSPSHRLEMTEILLKGRKTLTHPSILHVAEKPIKFDCRFLL